MNEVGAGTLAEVGQGKSARGPVASMTGFASFTGSKADGDAGPKTGWTWEARSVNGRSLDLKIRLPAGWDRLEPEVRRRLAAALARGNVSVTLSIDRPSAGAAFQVNEAQLATYLGILARLRDEHGLAPARADAVLSLRGVLETADDATATSPDIDDALRAGLDELVDGLVAARCAEGARLADILERQFSAIEAIVEEVAEIARAAPDLLKRRVLRQISDLADGLPAISGERLAQEVAVLAGKADITEEIERLRAHVAAARDLLAEGGPIGRRLDFLAQEFNREANTICSKAADTEITRGGLALKAAIEQMREQIQNVE